MSDKGNAYRDNNGEVIPVGNKFQTYDAADTPKESPYSLANNTTVEITVPERAVEIAVKSDASLIIGEAQADVEGTGNGYFTTVEYMFIPLGVGGMSSLFIRNESGATVNVEFFFIMV